MTAYDEITVALMFYIGTEDEDALREVVGQEHDPIEFIADALDAYREYRAGVA